MASSPAFGPITAQGRTFLIGTVQHSLCPAFLHHTFRAVFSHAGRKAAQLSPPALPVNMALKDYNAANVNSSELAGRDELVSVDGRVTLWSSYHELVAAVHHNLLGRQVWISLWASAHRRVAVPLR